MPRIPTSANSVDANPVIDADDYDPVEIISSAIKDDNEGGQEIMWTLAIREEGPAKDFTLWLRHPLQGYDWEKGDDGRWGIVRDADGKAVVTESRTAAALAAVKRFYMAAMGLTTKEESKVPDEWNTEDCHGKLVAITVTQKEDSNGIPRNNIKAVRISAPSDGRRR